MTQPDKPDVIRIGDRVRVPQGRWTGRVGVLIGSHFNPGSPGGQQSRAYPIVRLDPSAHAIARDVTVVTVERAVDSFKASEAEVNDGTASAPSADGEYVSPDESKGAYGAPASASETLLTDAPSIFRNADPRELRMTIAGIIAEFEFGTGVRPTYVDVAAAEAILTLLNPPFEIGRDDV